MTDNQADIVVLISANQEWRVVKEFFQPEAVLSTPFGEAFMRPEEGQIVWWMHGGWGKISAAASAQYALDHFHPHLLVNLGTCGGFDGHVQRGDIILVTETIAYDIIERMSDPEAAIRFYATRLDLPLQADPPQAVRRARMLSADQDLDPHMIDSLHARYGAVAVDWESAPIAWVARRNRIQCLILRGVSDLVSPNGGEAYQGDISVFHNGTRRVMESILQTFPRWLNTIRIS